jgi:hypothetical protein
MAKSRRLLLDPRQFVELYFTSSAILWAFRRTNRRFKLQKRRQLFIRTHNETLSVQFRQLLKFTATGESGFTSLRAAADLCFLFDVRKS